MRLSRTRWVKVKEWGILEIFGMTFILLTKELEQKEVSE